MQTAERQTNATPRLVSAADAMHALLMKRADKLVSHAENSAEEAEYARIADALVAYKEQRWPEGKVPGGKG